MKSTWEKIRETKKKFLGQMDSYRKNKLEHMQLESLRMEKEAQIRKNYEEARLKLDKAKKMKRDRIMAPLKNVRKRAVKMRSESKKELFKKDKWEPKSLI
jgi:hypothetical protein